jgi:hypothetical protein
MKVYILKKQVNFGEFEDPVQFHSTPWVFINKENAENKAKELDSTDPMCQNKDSWNLPTWVEEVDLI